MTSSERGTTQLKTEIIKRALIVYKKLSVITIIMIVGIIFFLAFAGITMVYNDSGMLALIVGLIGAALGIKGAIRR